MYREHSIPCMVEITYVYIHDFMITVVVHLKALHQPRRQLAEDYTYVFGEFWVATSEHQYTCAFVWNYVAEYVSDVCVRLEPVKRAILWFSPQDDIYQCTFRLIMHRWLTVRIFDPYTDMWSHELRGEYVCNRGAHQYSFVPYCSFFSGKMSVIILRCWQFVAASQWEISPSS